MNFFSIRTNDQESIGQILKGTKHIVFDRLSWHKDEISIGDIVFIVISGDSSKKIHTYDNGLRAIGKVVNLPNGEEDEKHFKLSVKIFEFLPKTFMKEDFYIYPSLKDAPNIGPETKQAPNQAFRKIDIEIGKLIIRALFDLLNVTLNKSIYDPIVDNDYKIVKLELISKNEADIKRDFYNFLRTSGRIETTIKQYINKLTEVGNWFFDNNIVDDKFNIWLNSDQIEKIDKKLNNELKELWLLTNKPIKNWYSSPWNAWNAFNSNKKIDLILDDNIAFSHKSFYLFTKNSGLIFSEKMVARFVASLCTKPFVICSGLSGSGKTKLAQAFVQWISESDAQYKIIPVGADWTNREPLLGYPNAIETDKYVVPENGALEILIKAINDENRPYFLILDEMNLSHVERYFADFLSAMESGEAIPLHTIKSIEKVIPQAIKLPKNLFIIGTVNIDETTYMFSPKVLDRANTIEFRLNEDDLTTYLDSSISLNMDLLKNKGADQAESFVTMATMDSTKDFVKLKVDLLNFFTELKKTGAEFGYRTASEIGRLIQKLEDLGESGDDLLDIAIMQKLLPKLHGSRSKLSKVLIVLGALCLTNPKDCKAKYFDQIDEIDFSDSNIRYKLSFEKIIRMYKNALDNGFASYAEA